MPSTRASRRRTRTAGRRGLGVAFLVVLVGFGLVTYGSFVKAFTPVSHVTLRTSHIGLQLNQHADVKLRGLIVGEVREIAVAEDGGARLDLAMQPDRMAQIPADVRARILPKTLFGEKYVALVPPEHPGDRHLVAGATIPADRSQVAIELETVLDDLQPLLSTIRPRQLKATLDAMATALEGRGNRIGDNLERLNGYLGKMEPHIPTMTKDLRQLADVADIYHEATPDLMRLLTNATRSGNTLVVKQRVLEDFLTDLTETSATTRRFLDRNERNLIRLGEVSRPTLDLLATYSPQYPCLLEGMVNWIPRMNDAFGAGEHYAGSAPAFHITLEVVPQRRGYTRDDKPAYVDGRGPGCRLLPDTRPYDQDNPVPRSGVKTGAGDQPGPGSRAPLGTPEEAGPSSGRSGPTRSAIPADPAGGTERVFDPTGSYAGTAAEQQLVDALLGPATGTPADEVPDIATLLFGPLARGTVVSTVSAKEGP